ncbi:MAG: VCBS repeat-containing protein, partial [Flavobacterium sp.]
MKKLLLLIFLLKSLFIFSQINFSAEQVLANEKNTTTINSNSFTADLNNDGFKELIVNASDNTLVWYKNVNGNLLYEQKHTIDNTYSLRGISAADLNNDNLNDIITIDSYLDKVSWYKNLGNDKFSNETIIASIDNPQSVEIADLNKDGFNDIVVCSLNSDGVLYYLNKGNGTFEQGKKISSSGYGFEKVKILDLNNDGFLDILSKSWGDQIFLNKNTGTGTFEPPVYVGYTADYSSFDFLDINKDGYLDLIAFNSDKKLSYYLSQNGDNFDFPIVIDNEANNFVELCVKDMDNDGLADIVASKSSNLGWYKNNPDKSFTFQTVSNSTIQFLKNLIVDDLNKDSIPEIICLSTLKTQASDKEKLSLYTYNSSSSLYDETIIKTWLSAISSIRIGDLNNDGLNDIVTGFSIVAWNKNLGNGNFSSQYLLPTDVTSFLSSKIELADMNNDGWIDIIAVTQYKFEIYKNNGNETFTTVYSIPLLSFQDIEIADFNNDGKPDICFTNPYSTDNKFGIIKNRGNFNFEDITPINFSTYYFKPYKIKSGDIDKDGDIDIVVSSETSSIQVLKNDGQGNFSLDTELTEITADAIELADIDNDGYLDIIAADGYSYSPRGVCWIKNDKGVFDSNSTIRIVDNNQSLQTLACGDLNGDGKIEIVGASYEYFAPYDEKLIAYSFENGSFQKTIIHNLGDAVSLSRDVTIGDLNNDHKLDIATSYYMIGKASYFINTSTLSIEDVQNSGSNTVHVYPNPTSDKISWDSEINYDIIIYDQSGRTV